MFEVLVFVYENYWRGDACPELEQLGRKLSAHGFEADEINEALVWLDGLNLAAQNTQLQRQFGRQLGNAWASSLSWNRPACCPRPCAKS
jgi:Smg protein